MLRRTRVAVVLGIVVTGLLLSSSLACCRQAAGIPREPIPTSTPSPRNRIVASQPAGTNTPAVHAAASAATTPSATPSPTRTWTVIASLPSVYLPKVQKSPPTPTPEPTPTTTPTIADGVHPQVPPLVLANYFPWFDPGTWVTGCTSGDDRPSAGVYNSDDPAVISRHIGQARSAGLSGFAVHWFAPGGRTDHNLRQLLERSPEGFDSSVTFLHHILPGVNQQAVIDALRHLQLTYGDHPRLLRLETKPVIFFADMYRVPDRAGRRPASDSDVATAVASWAEIRTAVDPGHTVWWIAEGERAAYLQVFDGLFVYKIDHACCPTAYQKASRWAGWVRDWERRTGRPKLWVGTVMPGWDDLNSAQEHCTDLRVSSEPFARDRGDGAYYARTWEAVLPTAPDLILVHSFNEWVEGSYIEPSNRFGQRYIELTSQWVARYEAGL